jgi:hypothetical protein
LEYSLVSLSESDSVLSSAFEMVWWLVLLLACWSASSLDCS